MSRVQEAHNAVAAVVEMYRGLLADQDAQIKARDLAIAALKKDLADAVSTFKADLEGARAGHAAAVAGYEERIASLTSQLKSRPR